MSLDSLGDLAIGKREESDHPNYEFDLDPVHWMRIKQRKPSSYSLRDRQFKILQLAAKKYRERTKASRWQGIPAPLPTPAIPAPPTTPQALLCLPNASPSATQLANERIEAIVQLRVHPFIFSDGFGFFTNTGARKRSFRQGVSPETPHAILAFDAMPISSATGSSKWIPSGHILIAHCDEPSEETPQDTGSPHESLPVLLTDPVTEHEARISVAAEMTEALPPLSSQTNQTGGALSTEQAPSYAGLFHASQETRILSFEVERPGIELYDAIEKFGVPKVLTQLEAMAQTMFQNLPLRPIPARTTSTRMPSLLSQICSSSSTFQSVIQTKKPHVKKHF
ncbi:hypothetical protein K458DRAFT_463641 [Lentithecium fluviatile CBS 122367]|uniref:Uncharacterized protein n=1 Tax=Lentithecium fluviatile CBS 122367 TaxID=1168545 RepID=A0A6G1IJP2_9PLEO|nr:hypothetical protein K458DRAFT_463641 [Lentithecium fluviatile CBS 122367]